MTAKLAPLAALSSALLLTACATSYGPPPPMLPPEPAPPVAAFNPAEFAWSTAPGRSSVRGVVAFKGAGGTYSCAGASVVLNPDTPFSRRRIIRLYGAPGPVAVPVATVRARQTTKAGEDYSAFVRTSKCDAQGRFSFDGLPAGGWFVISIAKPVGGDGEAMALVRPVRTAPGKVSQITLP
ncbi:MAG: hypothetical protein ACXWVJ_08055 [Caulobacteraceae bacterium]